MKQLARVSQMLRIWEDCIFLYGMRKALNARTGGIPPSPLDWVVKNNRQLRTEVHAKATGSLDHLAPYLQPEDTLIEAVGATRVMIPVHVASWMTESRRGYRLSRDLQALLNATSLKGVTWSGIPWPSGAFVVGLEEPIIDKTGAPIDAILVNGICLADPGGGEPRTLISFRLLSKRLERAPLEPGTRARMEKALAEKRWPTLDAEFKAARQRVHAGSLSNFGLFEDGIADLPVTDSIDDLMQKQHGKLCGCGGTHPEWDQAARLVIGLCLYLDTLPKDTALVSPWKACPDPVLHGAEYAVVSTDKPLTSEHRRMFLGIGMLGGGSDLPAHIKPGHWRRPPRRKDAEGEDTRTKTVHVRPHIVLRRKAAGNELAGLEHRLAAAEREDAANDEPA